MKQLRAMMSSAEQWVFNRTWIGELYLAVWSKRDNAWWLVKGGLTEISCLGSSSSVATALLAVETVEWQQVEKYMAKH
jgi:hypothetical protein